MQEPVNAAYGANEVPPEPERPAYIAGYRIPTDKIQVFVAANVFFIVVLFIVTTLVLPMGIPFLAAKKSEGFLTYVGFFFTYMFGYFAFFLLMLVTVGATGYAVQKTYFPGLSLVEPSDPAATTAAPAETPATATPAAATPAA